MHWLLLSYNLMETDRGNLKRNGSGRSMDKCKGTYSKLTGDFSIHMLSRIKEYLFGLGKLHIEDIEYSNMRTLEMTEGQIEQCAALFSNNYGQYSKRSEIRPGERVKLSSAYYRKNYMKEDYYVALAEHKNRVVGQAFYIRKKYVNIGIMTWIVQLVVDIDYRKRGIAGTLLRSIWGFSDDYAWGLATANPCTVKTLESATMRKCKPKVIKRHVKDICKLQEDVAFAKGADIEISHTLSQINTHFDVDNSKFAGLKIYERRLGRLKPGREWLAFTFQDQAIQRDIYIEKFDSLVTFSEKQLNEAYSRMPMENQTWTKGSSSEIDYILGFMRDIEDIQAVDFGCGIGRHTVELAKRGIDTLGIDYSERHIIYANEVIEREGIGNCSFLRRDAREFTTEVKYDLALCLYDVVGSYPNYEDNMKIINMVYKCLKAGGVLALSVMNMELTEYIVPESHKGRVKKDPQLLLKLKPGNIMQQTGNVFDPEHIVIDTEENLVYRKEQFKDDKKLSAEHIIRDKRYRMVEISRMVNDAGFDIIDKRYVSAGAFNESLNATNPHAKEILIIARK